MASIPFLFYCLSVGIVSAGEWHAWNQTNYYFASDKSYHYPAMSDCENRHATLAVITSEEEQNFLTQRMTDGNEYWIGLRQGSWKCSCKNPPNETYCQQCRDSWRWGDGTPMGYYNWAGDEPQFSRFGRIIAPSGLWAEFSNRKNCSRICEKPLCADITCRNGDCKAFDGVASCVCIQGYTGQFCENDIDECEEDNPCQHGSMCTNSFGGYNCICTDGFIGQNCPIDIDECSESHPCPLSATCANNIGGFDCICLSGFTGATCESDIDECKQANPCRFGATCTNTFGGYDCSCSYGYNGKNCTIAYQLDNGGGDSNGLIIGLSVVSTVLLCVVVVAVVYCLRKKTCNNSDQIDQHYENTDRKDQTPDHDINVYQELESGGVNHDYENIAMN